MRIYCVQLHATTFFWHNQRCAEAAALADDTVSLLPIRQSFEGILTKSNKFKPALIVALLLHHSSKNLEKCK